MFSLAFRTCHNITKSWEGGWSNHPSDRGGKTMYGITEAVYHDWLSRKKLPKKPVKNITMAEAEEIYYFDYWLAARCDTLRAGVNLAVYDPAVNSGVSRGLKWLKASYGGSDIETIKKICAKRLSFMQSLKNWNVFGKGWLRRVTGIEAAAVKMNMEAYAVSEKEIVDRLEIERDQAKQSSKNNVKGAVATGSADVGGVTLTPDQVDTAANILLGGILAAGVALLLFLILRSVIHSYRAEAYEKATAQTIKGSAA